MNAAPTSQAAAFGNAIQGGRREQEDSFRICWLASESAVLLILADGMGGHAAGELASRLVVDSFATAFAVACRADRDLEAALRTSLDAANDTIADTLRERAELSGMGTTIVAAHLSGGGITWISVGDSPLWLYRRGALFRLNADHSLRQKVGPEDHCAGNLLESALTGETIALIDCRSSPISLDADDIILIASDGILTLSEDNIAEILASSLDNDPKHLVDTLLGAVAACAKPNQDNCTIVVANPPLRG